MQANTFLTHTGRSVSIWLLTNAIASAIYLLARLLHFDFTLVRCDFCAPELGFILLLGLAVSFLVTPLLLILLYVLPFLKPGRARGWFSAGFLLFASVIIILFFLKAFHAPKEDRILIALFLIPYIISGCASFFLLTYRALKDPETHRINPLHLLHNIKSKLNYGK